MWNAKIADKKFENGVLAVIVAFSNGTTEHTEVFTIRNGAELAGNINRRLDEMNALETFVSTLEIGDYEREAVQEMSPKMVLDVKLATLESLKKLVEAGAIKETDKEFTDAQVEVKNAYIALEN